MSGDPSERDRFIHALLSPLTTLQGAMSLIARRLSGHPDPNLGALLASLERSSTRLRSLADLLVQGMRVERDRIVVEVPLAELHAAIAPTPDQPRRSQVAPPARDTAGEVRPPSKAWPRAEQVLVLAAAASRGAAIGAALRARGHHVEIATSSAQGLDLARSSRPTLVLIDPSLDPQGEPALRVLEEDPDLKGVTLAVIAPDGTPGGLYPPLIIERGTPIERAIDLLDQALAPGHSAREDRPHLLIVDDEPDIAELIALQFADEGYQTTTLHSGTEVLRTVREQQFGLILLDVMLPDIDGFTVLGGLRAQPETQLTPIIMVSAINSPAEKVRGLQLGADDYITKPFSAAELSARVQAAFRRSEREGGANPSTRLPGNSAIERAISQRIAQGQPFAVCYGDLDNFKAYNDSYGFLKGDAVIQRTAQILMDAVRAHGNPDDFVGHIGGDDFVLITMPDRVAPICTMAAHAFDATAPLFYDAADRAQGYISGLDRQGRPNNFPLVSITFAVVSSARRPFSHPGEVAQRAVEAKKRAKQIPGSIYLVEE